MRTATSSLTMDRRRAFRVSSHAATFKITSTDRRLPRPGQAAWPRSTPSIIWRTSPNTWPRYLPPMNSALVDPSPTHDAILVIEHHSLSRRDRKLGSVEDDFGPAVANRLNRRGRGLM